MSSPFSSRSPEPVATGTRRSTTRRALFLDRDGTLIVHIPYLHHAEGVEILPGARSGLIRAREAGFALYLFTNQSGVGRGMFDLSAVHSVNERMLDLLNLGPNLFAGICIAPEAPEAPAVYRKPSPRYILETCAADALDPGQCWMVGDSPSDWQAGLSAGIHAAAVACDAHESAEHRSKREAASVPGYADLDAAVTAILGSVSAC